MTDGSTDSSASSVPPPLSERIRGGWVAPLAARLRSTEGEVQAMAVLVVAVTLISLLALPGVRWSAPRAAAAAAPAPRFASTTQPPGSSGQSLRPVTATPVTGTPSPPAGDEATTTTTTTTTAAPRPVPACAAAASLAFVRATLAPLAATGIVPVDAAVEVLAAVSGCTEAQVGDALLTLAYTLGDQLRALGLPDLNLLPPLPVLPPELTSPFGPLLAPLLTPVCETLGTVLPLFVVIGSHFPQTLTSSDLLNVILYAAITCSALVSG